MRTNFISLRKMQVVSWIYLTLLTVGCLIVSTWTIAWSALVGGIISVLSFWLSYRDLTGFMSSLVSSTDVTQREAKAQFGKSGYLFKFWIRIAIIGVVVLLLMKFSSINAFGLILGLSTIVFTVTFTAVDIVRHYYFSGRR